jgi:hypothetical protein
LKFYLQKFIANRIPNIPYVDLEAANVFGSNLGKFLCTEGFRLTLCKLFNFWLLGGDPAKPLEGNTDPVRCNNVIIILITNLNSFTVRLSKNYSCVIAKNRSTTSYAYCPDHNQSKIYALQLWS